MSGFSFAGLPPSEIAGIGNDLSLLDKITLRWGRWCDYEWVEANVRKCKEAEAAALKAMADAATAEQSLASVKSDLERQSAALAAREQAVTDRENKLFAREQARSLSAKKIGTRRSPRSVGWRHRRSIMGAVIKTDGPKAHNDALIQAERVRQATIVAGASMATVRAADIQFARSALSSCLSNNGGAGASQFTSMLQENGVQT